MDLRGSGRLLQRPCTGVRARWALSGSLNSSTTSQHWAAGRIINDRSIPGSGRLTTVTTANVHGCDCFGCHVPGRMSKWGRSSHRSRPDAVLTIAKTKAALPRALPTLSYAITFSLQAAHGIAAGVLSILDGTLRRTAVPRDPSHQRRELDLRAPRSKRIGCQRPPGRQDWP